MALIASVRPTASSNAARETAARATPDKPRLVGSAPTRVLMLGHCSSLFICPLAANLKRRGDFAEHNRERQEKQ